MDWPLSPASERPSPKSPPASENNSSRRSQTQTAQPRKRSIQCSPDTVADGIALSQAVDAASTPPTEDRQHVPERRRTSSVASLLRRLRASGSVHPDSEKRHAVQLFSADFDKYAFDAVFSQRLERSLVTASAVRFLGFKPMDLPPGADRRRFVSPWGFIYPKTFVTLVIEQARINLPPTPRDFIVVDDRFSERGFDIFLGRRCLQAMFGGRLPCNTSDAGNQQAQPRDPAANSNFDGSNAPNWGFDASLGGSVPTAPWLPLMSMDSGPQLTGNPTRSTQEQATSDGGISYQIAPPFSASHVPIIAEEHDFPHPLQGRWGHDSNHGPHSTQWPPLGPLDDLDAGDTGGWTM
ncbi:uncharacterized protein THITE_157951 [Thermothielavioides terrestris NRRL 8126]|uniref:Uncharacterized protein n=1 Tax=Thermothielavioides terrestris (strain ATCC 38088 / NRRL 8126) TaxID=578455 RepID=G2QXL1_THETT|nr:uncharacterized protein THITE_157951 [Thermothielavioides terrestris NRRL 8126]AEO64036.1 hypothetical protein THITE_157951 [Thermothielavioides terrestris NRRL 8126]